MFQDGKVLENYPLELRALDSASLTVTFSADGRITSANRKFLDLFGYALDEIIGQDESILISDSSRGIQNIFVSDVLGKGGPQTISSFYLTKTGAEVWLHVQYFPFFDLAGSAVVAVAANLSDNKSTQLDYRGQINAINASQAVIHFSLDGIILDANDLFLDAMGYTFEEVEGHHHRMFVEPAHAHSSDYASFWRDLRLGRHHAGQYRRIGKSGRDVWLQATYNPIVDIKGRPVKVVKYATVITEERHQQADHQGQIAAIHKSQCVISFDLTGIIVDANDNYLNTMGYRLADVRGRHHRMFVDETLATSVDYDRFWSALASGQHQSGECRRIHKDGREIWLQATYNPIFDTNGRPFKIVKYATDVTREKLRQADYQGQIEAINKSQGIVTFALDGTILDVNENFLMTLGYTIDEVRGRHHSVFVEPGYANSSEYRNFWDALRSGEFHSGIYKRFGKNGHELWINASYNPILGPDQKPMKVIKFATDITSNVALAAAYDDATRQARHDAATSLPNRIKLAEFMSSCLADAEGTLTVFYVDLDRFKPINDKYGHHVGDRVLGEVADRLRRSLKPDQIVARVGGDEFVIAARDLPEEEIDQFTNDILHSVKAPIQLEIGEIAVSLSIGIAISPADGTTPDALLRSADAALYRSKQAGRGVYRFFAAEFNDRMVLEKQFGEEIRDALDAGQFFLEYQPRFDTREREVRSVEALVRWLHPTRGRVTAADFIPFAERNGFIVQLGQWILNSACKAAAAWPEIAVSVNISSVQFREREFVGTVKAALENSGLDCGRLELEITEQILLEDAAQTEDIVRDLKQLGIKLVMDDFGTGYSSLSHLHKFPFDIVKIDRSVVACLETQDDARSIVQAIIAIGKALGISVGAKGVETNAQLAILTMDQCVEVQGRLLAEPLHPDKITEILKILPQIQAKQQEESGQICEIA